MALLERVDYAVIIWFLAVAYAFHEAEEWNILEWHERNFGDMPAHTTTGIRTFLVFASVVMLIWAGLATVWGNPKVATFLFLPAAAVAFQNGLQHVYWLFAFREYAPGVVTSVLVVIPATICLVVEGVRRAYVPAWYVVGLAILVVSGMVQTVRSGNRLTRELRAILDFGEALSRWVLRGKG